MKKLQFLISILILIISCNSKQQSEELDRLKKELDENEETFSKLKKEGDKLKSQYDSLLEEISDESQSSENSDFNENYQSKVKIGERLIRGEQKLIDKKKFKDTLDISDNFFVYEHTSKIIQTSDSELEAVLRDFDQVKSVYGSDFFVRVITFYNGQSLPLETENSKTDIHILIQPTELSYENKTFVISDFYKVDLKTLEKKENNIELTFEHGKFPRKRELIVINPELAKFGSK